MTKLNKIGLIMIMFGYNSIYKTNSLLEWVTYVILLVGINLFLHEKGGE